MPEVEGDTPTTLTVTPDPVPFSFPPLDLSPTVAAAADATPATITIGGPEHVDQFGPFDLVVTSPIDPNGDPPTGTAVCKWPFEIPLSAAMVAAGQPHQFTGGQVVTDPALLVLFVRYVCPVEWAKEV